MEKKWSCLFHRKQVLKCEHITERMLPTREHQTNSSPPPAVTVYPKTSDISFSFHFSGIKIYILSIIISSVENVHCLKIEKLLYSGGGFFFYILALETNRGKLSMCNDYYPECYTYYLNSYICSALAPLRFIGTLDHLLPSLLRCPRNLMGRGMLSGVFLA